ncbi:MAG: hypothetical protein VKK42_15775 [Lyngbya sp.]|nr:hypothetical protein [Lyngbya sp.]
MNTATVFNLKGEFETLLDSMKTFGEHSHSFEPKTLEAIQEFKNQLLSIKSSLENELKNNQVFGDLDKLEVKLADESDKNLRDEKRDRLDKIIDKIIEHSSFLIDFCTMATRKSSEHNFDLILKTFPAIISLIREDLAVDRQNNPLSYSVEKLKHLEASQNTFVTQQVDPVQAEETVKLIDKFQSNIQGNQLLPSENIEKKFLEDAEFKLKTELQNQYQEQLKQLKTQLQNQYQEQLKQREAELSRQHQQELEQYESQLKRQHQKQLKQRETELHSQYQQQIKQLKEKLSPEERERLQESIGELESEINKTEIKPDIDRNNSERQTRKKSGSNLLISLILLIPLLITIGFDIKNKQPHSLSERSELTKKDNIKSAQKLAEEAGEMIDNPPHPLTVWQTAQDKWGKAIQLLEEVSHEQKDSEEIENKLKIYRTDYNTITQKIAQEQKAVNNLEAAQKLALEASAMVKNPPYPLTVWQTAEDKWEKAVNLLESIPEDAFIASEAQEKLEIYRTNLEIISQRVKTESL